MNQSGFSERLVRGLSKNAFRVTKIFYVNLKLFYAFKSQLNKTRWIHYWIGIKVNSSPKLRDGHQHEYLMLKGLRDKNCLLCDSIYRTRVGLSDPVWIKMLGWLRPENWDQIRLWEYYATNIIEQLIGLKERLTTRMSEFKLDSNHQLGGHIFLIHSD